MIDIPKLLYEICGNEAVYDPDCELLESGLLDSLALIELVSRLEDEGVVIHLTRIDRQLLKTPRSIAKLVSENK
ncbi:MAG: D-alanine--poly(phosphoribitol) ligase subunit 2 [Clostridia bacterium]|nr:D-alanine--poly(phosphoribitol) ligase subunit 2 [Clostridia bacterium]MBR3996796.1 D-alanine--poly(phosphoribitol) ligase subunit 2 [Clostridia bacterium]